VLGMGLEVLEPIINAFKGLQYGGIAQWLAFIGLGIILTIGLVYAIYGLIKLGKMVLSLKVKEFTVFLLVLGAILLGIALVLP